jgi:UDP-N-acetylmuramate dehydrogenase
VEKRKRIKIKPMDKLLEKFSNIKVDYGLAPLTTFKIGGPAKYYLETKDIEDLQEVVKFCKENDIDFKVIGGGSNFLVNDLGYKGLIIKYINRNIDLIDGVFKVGAGVVLLNFVYQSLEKGFAGQESLAGIPGTVGGAIFGNAGAYGKAIGDLIKSVKIIDENGNIKILSQEDCNFNYRKSIFSSRKVIILDVEIILVKKDNEEEKEIVKNNVMVRVEKHPLNFPNSGSWFKNVALTNEVGEKLSDFDLSKFEKYKKIPAAFLIEQAGLKGHQIGGAQMSEKHANFLVNKDNAKAEDVVKLSNYVKEQVKEKYDIELEEEVQYIGF